MSTPKADAQSLLDENPEFESVIETLLKIEETNGEVKWKDVRTEIDSGQWGRLIEKGVLVESGDGFAFADKDAMKELVETTDVTTETEVPEDVDTSWTILDKGAALVGLFLIVFGYRDPPILAAIAGVINTFVSPLHSVINLPFYLIVMLLAISTGLYSSYLQLYLIDRDWVNAQQKKVKEIQSQLKEAQEDGDDDKEEELQEEQKEVMSEQMKMFKMQFKPSVWIMMITIPIFMWMYWSFGGRSNIPAHITEPIINMPYVTSEPVHLNTQVVGFLPIGQAWFVWYILCSFGFGQIMRKVLGVNTST